MRRIVKTHPPLEMRNWTATNRELNFTYSSLLGAPAVPPSTEGPHAALKNQLLSEQGFLCAYTGRRIISDTSHVEHLKPQTKCKLGEDVDYRNVVACFPFNGGDNSYGYGAPVKAGWWDEERFVSPLLDGCDRRFTFTWSGKIKPFQEDDDAATTTINKIGLQSDALSDLRRARIDGFFGFNAQSRGNSLSKADAARILSLIDTPDASGALQEYCFVVKQLLLKYIARAT